MEYTIKVLNLKRRVDRKEAFIDHHVKLGYDPSMFNFHYGHDAADYKTTADIVKAMNEKYPIGEIIHFRKGDYGCFWSLSDLVESIAHNKSESEYVLYSLDDSYLTIDPDRLNNIFDYGLSIQPNQINSKSNHNPLCESGLFLLLDTFQSPTKHTCLLYTSPSPRD